MTTATIASPKPALPASARKLVPAGKASAREELSDGKPNYAVLIYCGINPTEPGGKREPVCASHQMLQAMKKLAPKTQNSAVAFFVQGYEKSSSGKWRTARYLISHGKVEEQTNQIQPENVSLFNPSAFKDFLASAPPAKKTMLFYEAHGRGFPGFGGEAVVNGKIDGSTQDEMTLTDFKKSISESGRKLHLLDLDTRFGGQWEVVTTLHSISPRIVASPEATHFFSTSYDPSPQVILPVFEKIIDNPSLSPGKLAKFIIRNTAANQSDLTLLPDSYTPTLALYSAEKVPALNDPIGKLGERLADALDNEKTKRLILKAAEKSLAYEVNDFKDLKSFVRQLKKNGVFEMCGIPEVRKEIKRALKESCAAMFKSMNGAKEYGKAGPLSLFVPSGPSKEELKEFLARRMQAQKGSDLAKARTDFLKSFSRQAEEISASYSSLDEIPEGWKKFVQKLLHVLVTEIIPERIKQVEP